MPFDDKLRFGILGSKAPRYYWYAWLAGGDDTLSVRLVETQGAPLPEPMPGGTDSSNPGALADLAGSAWVVASRAPAIRPQPEAASPDELGSLEGLDADIAERVRLTFRTLNANDRSKWRAEDFDGFRKGVLIKLKGPIVRRSLENAREYVHDLLAGSPWPEAFRADWEAYVEESAAFRVAGASAAGPSASGQAPQAFHLFIGVSAPGNWGSASGTAWTFIEESVALSRGGLAHSIGIYGCGDIMSYPCAVSDFGTSGRAFPSSNMQAVERDFLRYWPDGPSRDEGGVRPQFVLPALYEDYVAHTGGDFVFMFDGSLARDIMFLEGDAARSCGKEWGFTIKEDPANPTVLMKLQDYMVKNRSGRGYALWLVPEGKPLFLCPSCGSPWPELVRFVSVDAKAKELVMECTNPQCKLEPVDGHKLYREGFNAQCPAAAQGCPLTRAGTTDCQDCRYMYLVLSGLFDRGKRIFRGSDDNSVANGVAKVISAQRTQRLIRGAVNNISLQDGEAPYNDLGTPGPVREG